MRRFALVLLLVFLTGCAYHIKTEHDAVLDRTTTRMSKNLIGSYSIFGANLVINGAKLEQSGRVSYSLWVQTLAPDWVFPTSLTMRVDDELVEFGQGARLSADVDCSGGSCQHDERYWYDATADQLKAIAGARAVIVRLGGRDGYIEKTFSEENIANFQDFVSKEVQ